MEYPVFLDNALLFTESDPTDWHLFVGELAWTAKRIQRWLNENHFNSAPCNVKDLFKRWLSLAQKLCDWSQLLPLQDDWLWGGTMIELIRVTVKRLKGLLNN